LLKDFSNGQRNPWQLWIMAVAAGPAPEVFSVELRDLRADERDKLIDHWVIAYQNDALRERAERALYDDTTLELAQIKVIVEDDEIVSAVRVANRPVRIGGIRVEMGGIGGVSTLPEYRSRGYSTRLLQAQITYMQQQGYDISMLFSGLIGFYRRVGWDCFPLHSCCVPVPKTLRAPAPRSPYTVRQYEQATDLPQVTRCYDEYNAYKALAMVRHPEYWQDKHAQFLGCRPWLVALKDGEVCAYVSGSPKAISEACCRDGHVQAFVALADATLTAAMEAEVEALECWIPFSHPLLAVFGEMLDERITHSVHESMMLRVINLRSLFEKLIPVLNTRLQQAGLAVSQPLTVSFDQVGQKATLRIHGPEAMICDDQPELPLDISGREFFLLACGAATIDELVEILTLRGIGIPAQYRKLLRILFPKQESVYYGCDHF